MYIQMNSSYMRKKMFTYWVQSWQWGTPRYLLLCPTKWNRHKCANLHHWGAPKWCMASMDGDTDFHPHMEHTSWKLGDHIWVSFHKYLKFIINNILVLILVLLISVHKSFFPLLVCGKHIENFVTLPVTHMEGMFHFQHINFQGWSHHGHGYHSTKGNAYSSFLL